MSYSNCNCIYFNKETTSALKQSAKTGIAEGSYSYRIAEDKKTGDVYIRSFLINDKLNSRNWRVNPATLENNVLSIIGKPLVRYIDPITGRVDHPPWHSWRSAQANIQAQEKKAIGRVERVLRGQQTGNYYVDVKVTDKEADNSSGVVILSMRFTSFVSSSNILSNSKISHLR